MLFLFIAASPFFIRRKSHLEKGRLKDLRIRKRMPFFPLMHVLQDEDIEAAEEGVASVRETSILMMGVFAEFSVKIILSG